MIPNKHDWQEIDSYLKIFSQITRQFLGELDDKNVAILESQLTQSKLVDKGVGFLSSVEKLCADLIPQLSASRGSRYWGFVTGGATPVATFADWLVSTFDQNLSNDGDSIASDVERQALSWLCELFNLPSEFTGIITTGATASNFLGALCGRQYAGLEQGIDVAKQGAYGLSVEIFSTTPHASMLKSLGMAGMGQQCITSINALPDSEAMDVRDLENKLKGSMAQAKIIIASAGTVTATDFDDLENIIQLRDKFAAWLHVDGAFGLFERLVTSSEKTLTKGIEFADSITVDSHKWLNVPYESGVFLTRHEKLLFDACDVPAPYLVNKSNKLGFMSLGIENSRRFRALPVWMTLLAYGRQGIASWVESNINLAKLFADKINNSDEYELLLDCKLNVVLFRPNCHGLSSSQSDQKTDKFLEAINKDGRIFLSPGKWQGKSIIRAALSNWETKIEDIDIAFDCLLDVARGYTQITSIDL